MLSEYSDIELTNRKENGKATTSSAMLSGEQVKSGTAKAGTSNTSQDPASGDYETVDDFLSSLGFGDENGKTSDSDRTFDQEDSNSQPTPTKTPPNERQKITDVQEASPLSQNTA